MFNEVIEISYFCRIPSGGLEFDELLANHWTPQCSSDPDYCVVVGASTKTFQAPPGCLPHTAT
jgi:hypothetical protein